MKEVVLCCVCQPQHENWDDVSKVQRCHFFRNRGCVCDPWNSPGNCRKTEQVYAHRAKKAAGLTMVKAIDRITGWAGWGCFIWIPM